MKKIILISITILFITKLTAQVKVGLPGKNITAVTLIKYDGDDNFVIYKDGKKVDLAPGTLQVNFGYNLISNPISIDTRKIKKLKYGKHVFIAAPRNNGKTKFCEIVMYNEKYYMTSVRGSSGVTITVYDRKTNKTVKGRAGKGFEITHNDTMRGGKGVKLTKAALKGRRKSVELISINTYFPECGNLEAEMLEKVEKGLSVLLDIEYKNCDNSEDIFMSWYN